MSIKKKDAEPQAKMIVERVFKENKYLSGVLKGVCSKMDSERYPNAIALENLSKDHPEIIYPEWNFFVNFLKSENAYHKSIAISTISNLIALDKQNKFKEVFEVYFNLLDDKSVIVSRKLAMVAGKIAKTKPKYKSKITKLLLKIDNTQHNQSRKDLIKGDIIEAFNDYFTIIEKKDQIIDFVKDQLSSSSPSTVKKARNFLSKWEKLEEYS